VIEAFLLLSFCREAFLKTLRKCSLSTNAVRNKSRKEIWIRKKAIFDTLVIFLYNRLCQIIQVIIELLNKRLGSRIFQFTVVIEQLIKMNGSDIGTQFGHFLQWKDFDFVMRLRLSQISNLCHLGIICMLFKVPIFFTYTIIIICVALIFHRFVINLTIIKGNSTASSATI